MSTKPEYDIYIGEKSKITGFMYGRDGMFFGVEITTDDGAMYNIRFAYPSTMHNMLEALSSNMLMAQAKLFALNQMLHDGENGVGCAQTHKLYRDLGEAVKGPLQAYGGTEPTPAIKN